MQIRIGTVVSKALMDKTFYLLVLQDENDEVLAEFKYCQS